MKSNEPHPEDTAGQAGASSPGREISACLVPQGDNLVKTVVEAGVVITAL